MADPTPRGKALDWSDEDLDRLAEVTPADIEQAKAAFRRDAPRGFKDLLDSEPEAE